MGTYMDQNLSASILYMCHLLLVNYNPVKSEKEKKTQYLFLIMHNYQLIVFITHFRPVCLVNLTISLRASSELD